MPYIVWVAAFNTSFMLAYLLLDLVFFPSPLSKSIYSPTSKLKVQPDPVLLNRDRSNAKGSEGTQIAPALLEAVNQNGLVIFLIVRTRSLSARSPGTNSRLGQRFDRIDQSCHPDDVCVGLVGYGDVVLVCFHNFCYRLAGERQKAFACIIPALIPCD